MCFLHVFVYTFYFLCVLETFFRFSTKESAAHAIVATHNTEVFQILRKRMLMMMKKEIMTKIKMKGGWPHSQVLMGQGERGSK